MSVLTRWKRFMLCWGWRGTCDGYYPTIVAPFSDLLRDSNRFASKKARKTQVLFGTRTDKGVEIN